MERLEIFAIADQRNFQVVTEDFQVASGLTALYKNLPCQLYIHFFNDDETPFAEQFFTLKGWSMVLADDFSNSTAVQLRADKVEAVGGNTLKAVFSNVNTIELAEVLGDSSAVKLGAEIIGSADGVDVVVWQFNMQIRNRREDNTQPTAVQGNYYTKAETQGLIANRVEKVQGMGLSSNDFTDEYKEKLDSVVTAYDDTQIKADIAELEKTVANKVEKVQGKGLSSEDFTTAEKQKLNGLQNYDDTIIRESISNLKENKLDKSAYTPYDDTQIKADIQEMQGGITSLATTVNGKADVSALADKADKSELFSKQYADLKNTPDLTVYATKEQVEKSIAESCNKLNCFTADDNSSAELQVSTFYSADYDIFKQKINNTDSIFTIKKFSSTFGKIGKIPTFEMWIQLQTNVTTFSIEQGIQLVGEIPTELQANYTDENSNVYPYIHVFVWRFATDDNGADIQLLSYSHKFYLKGGNQ